MRNLLRAVLVAVGLSLFTAGCGGDDPAGPDGGPDGNLGAGTMTALVDGVPWTATSTGGFRNAEGIIGVSGNAAGQTVIAFALDVDAPGTYAIPFPGLNFNYSVLSPTALWQAVGMGQLGAVGEGSVTITTLTQTRIAGTFHFRAPAATASSSTGEKVVTQGAFDIGIIP